MEKKIMTEDGCSFGLWPAKNKEKFQWHIFNSECYTKYCSTQCTIIQDALIKDKIIFQVIG